MEPALLIFAMASDSSWEHFDRGADVGVRGFGPSQAMAFEQAALAMTALIVEPSAVQPMEWVELCVSAADAPLLLADWLNAVLTEMSARRVLFCRFQVTLDGNVLSARLAGEPLSVERHRLRADVRAASHADSIVALEGERWVAQAILGM